MHTFALALAYVSAAIVVATVLPQLARTIRHPGLTGVSPVSWTLTAASSLSWLAYGLLTATPFQIPGNVVLCTGSVALVLLVPSRWRRGHRAVVVGGALVVVVVAALTLPPSIVAACRPSIVVTGSRAWRATWRSETCHSLRPLARAVRT